MVDDTNGQISSSAITGCPETEKSRRTSSSAGRGGAGATILMRAVLRAHRDTEKSVWVADSFEGLPGPRSGLDLAWTRVRWPLPWRKFRRTSPLRASRREGPVLKGHFNKTLPTAPIAKLSSVEGRRGFYDSQMDVLNNSLPKLSIGATQLSTITSRLRVADALLVI